MREQRGALLQPYTRPFARLAEDDVCLACASPLSTNCGFSNFSLGRVDVADGEPERWQLEMAPCNCEHCDRHACESVNCNDLQDGNARERLLERHRFKKLDAILGVDEHIDSVRLRPANRVPVLVLRLMVADHAAELGIDPREHGELLDAVFCSLEQTAAFVVTTRGQEVLRELVFDRAAELEARHQITVPSAVATRVGRYHYFYYSAALLRVVVALELIELLTRDLRFKFETCDLVQRFVLNLWLFADTHLDLFVACEAMGSVYTDEWLTMPSSYAVVLNLPPLPDNPSAEQTRARKEAQRRALMSDAIYFTPLERAYPHPLRAVYAGELIDLSNSLIQSNLWTTVREVSASDTAKCLHVLLGKAAPHKCLKRNIDIMLSQEIGSQPVLLAVVNNLLEVTQLGNYPDARQRATWRTRLCVRRSYHWERFELHTWCAACHRGMLQSCPKCAALRTSDPTTFDGKKAAEIHKNHLCDVCQFLRHHKYLVFFAIKEFYVFLVGQHGLLRTMLELETGWIEHRTLLLYALDDARRIMSGAFRDRHNANADVVRRALWRAVRHLILMHDCNKPTMKRLYKSPYLYEQMLSKMHRHHRASLVVWQWTGCQRPEDFLVAPLRRGTGHADEFPVDGHPEVTRRFYACDERLPHLGGRRWCDVYTLEQVETVAAYCVTHLGGDVVPSMLNVVGMSPHGAAVLAELCFNSTVRDMPDNQLNDRCKSVGKVHMTDFHLLHYFLAMMRHRHAVWSFALDFEQTWLQATALRLRHKVDWWGALPEETHHVAVCRNDEAMFSTVVEAATDDEIDEALAKDGSALTLDQSIYARGVTSAIYDHELCGLVCPRDSKSANAKRWRKFDLQRALWWRCASTTPAALKKAKSSALSIRTSLENRRECVRNPLEYHSLLGRVLVVGHRAYTLCVKCGAVCAYQDTCVTTHGMTCGREVRFAERDRYTAIQQFATRQTTALRNADDGGIFALKETILLAPTSTRDPRADLLDRTVTPVFDQSRGYERLLFINAMNAKPRQLIDNGDKLMKEDITYLLDSDQSASTSGRGVQHSRASQPRTSRKQKELTTDELPAVATVEDANDDDDDDDDDKDDKVGASTSPALPSTTTPSSAPPTTSEYVVPMKFAERKQRAAVPYAERHRVQPHNYSDVEWAALSDESKLFAWTNEGRLHREHYLRLKERPAHETQRAMPELLLREDERREQLHKQGFYEKELHRMRCIDECAASEARLRRTLLLDNFTDTQITVVRDACVEAGWLELRHNIVCAYCRVEADPRGQYRRLAVSNLDGMLVNPVTNRPLEERGIVNIFLCGGEFKHIERLLRESDVPLASDLFMAIDAKRQRARTQALKTGKR